jgi:hypothetical protein
MTDSNNEVKESDTPQSDVSNQAEGNQQEPENANIRLEKFKRQRDEERELRQQEQKEREKLALELAELKGMVIGKGLDSKKEEEELEDMTDQEKKLHLKTKELEKKQNNLENIIASEKQKLRDNEDKRFLAEKNIDVEDFKYYAKKYFNERPEVSIAFSQGNLGVQDIHNMIATKYDYMNPNKLMFSSSEVATARDEKPKQNKQQQWDSLNKSMDDFSSGPKQKETMEQAIDLLVKEMNL